MTGLRARYLWPGGLVLVCLGLLELAAGHGSHEAEYQLSLQQVDREQQVYWLEKAANGGVPKALFELANLPCHGLWREK